nr:MAG TPA: hypothetical protein [Caudoviricetes sp.]
MNGTNRKYLYRSFRQFSERHYRGGVVSSDVSRLKNTI